MSIHVLHASCLRCPRKSPGPYGPDNPMLCLAGDGAPVDTQERFRSRFCPLGRFPAADAEIEELFARDKAEGGCGCDGSGYSRVERPA